MNIRKMSVVYKSNDTPLKIIPCWNEVKAWNMSSENSAGRFQPDGTFMITSCSNHDKFRSKSRCHFKSQCEYDGAIQIIPKQNKESCDALSPREKWSFLTAQIDAEIHASTPPPVTIITSHNSRLRKQLLRSAFSRRFLNGSVIRVWCDGVDGVVRAQWLNPPPGRSGEGVEKVLSEPQGVLLPRHGHVYIVRHGNGYHNNATMAGKVLHPHQIVDAFLTEKGIGDAVSAGHVIHTSICSEYTGAQKKDIPILLFASYLARSQETTMFVFRTLLNTGEYPQLFVRKMVQEQHQHMVHLSFQRYKKAGLRRLLQQMPVIHLSIACTPHGRFDFVLDTHNQLLYDDAALTPIVREGTVPGTFRHLSTQSIINIQLQQERPSVTINNNDCEVQWQGSTAYFYLLTTNSRRKHHF